MEQELCRYTHDNSCNSNTPCENYIKDKITEYVVCIADIYVKAITERTRNRQKKESLDSNHSDHD